MSVVDVVIVSYNSETVLTQAVASVRACDCVARIVVIDNASADGSAAVARAAGADEVVQAGGNLGFAAAVNLGLQRCDTEFVLLLNPDATVGGECLDALVAALRADEQAAVAAPVLCGADGSLVLGAERFSTVVNRVVVDLPVLYRLRRLTSACPRAAAMIAASATVPVDYVWGAALLARRSFLEQIGGLDERFFLYHEDEDLGRAVRRAGLRVLLVCGARARHVGNASSAGDAALMHARLRFATVQLLSKWHGRGSAVAFSVLVRGALAAQWLRAALRRDHQGARQANRTLRLFGGFLRRGSARGAGCC